MKTPKEIIEYRNRVLKLFDWAVGNGFITKEIVEDCLKPNVYEIELDMYPKELVQDENGWTQVKSEWIDGLPIDEWE